MLSLLCQCPEYILCAERHKCKELLFCKTMYLFAKKGNVTIFFVVVIIYLVINIFLLIPHWLKIWHNAVRCWTCEQWELWSHRVWMRRQSQWDLAHVMDSQRYQNCIQMGASAHNQISFSVPNDFCLLNTEFTFVCLFNTFFCA